MVRHFAQLPADVRSELFEVEPEEVAVGADFLTLATSLGATLYSPGVRPTLANDIVRWGRTGLTSMVICLEDSIADHQVGEAEDKLVAAVKQNFAEHQTDAGLRPLVFARVRRADQIVDIAQRLGEATAALAGFVLPNFTGQLAYDYFQATKEASEIAGKTFLTMPILESPDIAFHETRYEALTEIKALIDENRDSVLAVRIGATDLSGAYGLRRSQGFTIYDVTVVAETIGAIVNTFGRYQDDYVITGPVWEYFETRERLFRSQLRSSPFAEHHATPLRDELLNRDIDGLMREIELDRVNGLQGKTVIHPSHVPVVHALSVVTLEEWDDAVRTLAQAARGGGVQASEYGNKMNESKPHQGWAERTLRRAKVFGVAREQTTFVDLLAACENN